jgi:hypothetical protein
MGSVLMIGGPGGKFGKKASNDNAGNDDAGDEGETEEDPSMGKEARKEAARAVIRAVKMGDVDGLDTALEAHYEACEGAGASSDEAE